MKAIILAAGRGSRLGRLSDDQPKCLLEVYGRPILNWQIDAMKTAAIEDISIVCGYRSEKINGALNKILNPKWAETNMVSSLRCAAEILRSEPVIISYSDIICQSQHFIDLQSEQAEIAITYDTQWHDLWSLRFENPLEDAETFKIHEGDLAEIGQKTDNLSDIEGQYMGLLKMTPSGWSKIEDYLNELDVVQVAKLDMTSLLSNLLDRKLKIATIPVRAGWVEIDSPEDIAVYERAISNGALCAHDWRETELKGK